MKTFMKHRTSLVLATLLISLLGGCSKQSPTATQQNPKGVALGVVDVSDGVESRHDIGDGRVCKIMPAVQKDGSLLLNLKIEEGGRLLAPLKVQTLSDRPVEVSLGEIGFSLTPHIKQ
jgi:hypothetical protein